RGGLHVLPAEVCPRVPVIAAREKVWGKAATGGRGRGITLGVGTRGSTMNAIERGAAAGLCAAAVASGAWGQTAPAVWKRQFGTVANDRVFSVAPDGAGGVFVA